MLSLLTGIFVSAALALSYGYFLQSRLLKHQVKEKNIDALLKALDEYERLAINYWGGDVENPHLVAVKQKVFSDLVHHIGGAYKLDAAMQIYLEELIMCATGGNYRSRGSKSNHRQQELVVTNANNLRLILMKSRYVSEGWVLRELGQKIKRWRSL